MGALARVAGAAFVLALGGFMALAFVSVGAFSGYHTGHSDTALLVAGGMVGIVSLTAIGWILFHRSTEG